MEDIGVASSSDDEVIMEQPTLPMYEFLDSDCSKGDVHHESYDVDDVVGCMDSKPNEEVLDCVNNERDSTKKQVLSMDTLNLLSKVPGLEHYPYFHTWRSIDGDRFVEYHSMEEMGKGTEDKPFRSHFPGSLILGKFHVGSDVHGNLNRLVIVQDAFTKKTDFLNSILYGSEGDPKFDLPDHMFLVCNSTRTATPPPASMTGGNIGRVSVSGNGCTMTGYCSCNQYKRNQVHRNKASTEKCTTTFEFGIPFTEFSRFLLDPHAQLCGYTVVKGRCIHPFNYICKRLNGNSRHFLKIQMKNSKKYPNEMAKEGLVALRNSSPLRYATGNHSNVLTTAQQVYELRRENKAESRQERNIFMTGFEDIKSIILAQQATERKDLDGRKLRNDQSEDMLGICRVHQSIPMHEIAVWTKSMCIFIGELCSNYPVVGSVDTTGGQLTTECDEFDGIMQHLKIVLQLRQTVLSSAKAKLAKVGDINSIIPFERVSSCNTTAAISNFARKIDESVMEATSSWWGKGKGVGVDFAVMQCDNAPQLITGILKGLGKPQMVDSQQVYHDMVMHLLLRHEGRLEKYSQMGEKGNFLVTKSAKEIYATIKKNAACLFKVCGNHTHKAMKDGYTNMKKKPKEVENFKKQVNQIHVGVAARLRRVKKLSNLISELAIVMHIFKAETILLPELNRKTAVQTKPHADDTMTIACSMDSWIDSSARNITIKNDDETSRRIEHSRRQIGVLNPKFECMKIAGNVIGGMKNEQFCHVRLVKMSKDKKKATIRVKFVYSPYKDDGQGGWFVSPAMTSGIEINVDIVDGEGPKCAANPLMSKRLFGYWQKWMQKVALWGIPILVEIAEPALDRIIYETNATVEGQNNSEKTFTSDFDETMASVPSFISHRWTDYDERELRIADDCKRLGITLESRAKRIRKKARRKEKIAE